MNIYGCDICRDRVPAVRAEMYFDSGLDWCLCETCAKPSQTPDNAEEMTS